MGCPETHGAVAVMFPGKEARAALIRAGIKLEAVGPTRFRVVPPEGGAAYLAPKGAWAAYCPGQAPRVGGCPDPAALVVVDAAGVVRAWVGVDTPYASLPGGH